MIPILINTSQDIMTDKQSEEMIDFNSLMMKKSLIKEDKKNKKVMIG